ncbi:MAG: OmpA family protein [Bacteroidales bacterium]|nr:OmpA family protein [Bacteroidales bacterium]
MKKIFLTLVFAALSLGALAQPFHKSWTIGVQGGAGYTIGEVAFKDLVSPSVALDLGYQFTPVFGLRLDVSGFKGKGGLATTQEAYAFNYGQAALDATFDLCNLFSDYKYHVVNPYAFIGFGANYRFGNDEANAIAANFPKDNYLWSDGTICPAGRLGIGIDFKVTPSFAITLEGVSNYLSDHFNSKIGSISKLDHQIQMLAGLKFFPGATKDAKAAAADAAAAAEAAAAALAEANKPKPEPVVEPAPAPEPVVVVKEPETLEEIVYFVIDKFDIRDSEMSKLQNVVDFMNKYPQSTVSILGIADKDTGTSSRNMYLSQQRAKVVADKLASMGISKGRIFTSASGDTVNPYPTPAENRVAVCIVK